MFTISFSVLLRAINYQYGKWFGTGKTIHITLFIQLEFNYRKLIPGVCTKTFSKAICIISLCKCIFWRRRLLFSLYSLPDVLCDPTDFIWMKGTPFEAMTGRTALSSHGLLSEVFLSCRGNARRSEHNPQDYFIITLIISTDVTESKKVAFG